MTFEKPAKMDQNPHPPANKRDPRLDFFRGIAMYIILIAHIPWNPFTLWIPARFGFSDATEIFVFCSGMASAIAFAKIFDIHGMLIGTARIAHRVWQVYWSHILMFFVIAAILAVIDSTGWFEKNYVNGLNLRPFFNKTAELLPALLSLTYVPNYFDILPMYLGILIMIPIVMGLSRISPIFAIIFVIGLWLVTQITGINISAEPWSDRKWFFNPFGWQLVFFTGFAFMRGWIKPPPVNWQLITVAIICIIITIPFAYYRIRQSNPDNELLMAFVSIIKDFREEYKILFKKTDFGILRYLHFLALAYVSWAAVGEGGKRLISSGIWGKIVSIIQKVGQQSLAVFLTSMVLARLLGVIRDQFAPHPTAPKDVNLVFIAIGFIIITCTAYFVGWIKSTPWRKPIPSG